MTAGTMRPDVRPASFEDGPDSSRADLALALAEMLPELTGYFLRRLGDRDDAADAAADTVLILLAKSGRIPSEPERLRQYAYGVARKVLARARRGRVRSSALAERLRQELTEEAPVPARFDEELERELGRLPERDRELLLLIAWEGFGVAEAGAVLGLRPAAARQRYSRVRAALRGRLGSDRSGVR